MNHTRLLFFLIIICFAYSCNTFKSNNLEDTYSETDKTILRFLRLYQSFIDATIEWHNIAEYNIVVNVYQNTDTIIYRFDAVGPNDISSQIVDCSFCYKIDNHKIFSNHSLLSIKSLSIDSVLSNINPKQYQDYRKNKTLQPPQFIWDTQGLKVVYIKKQLSSVKFVWGLE